MKVEPLEAPSLLLGVELPAAPVLPGVPELELLLEEALLEEPLLLEDALVVPVAETVWPTSPESETIVPSSGA
jgi:hypothetical protein